MSYNTRRSQGFGPGQQNSNSVGQRRPVMTNNFMPGGQLAGTQQQQQKPPVQRQTQHQQQQQQQSGINFRNQQNQNNAQQQPAQPAQQQQLSQTYYKSQIKQEPKPVQPQPPKVTPIAPPANPEPKQQVETMDTAGEVDVSPSKKLWIKKTGKVSKAERNRRRNMRLSKILQPKNGVMILNELVKGCQFVVEQAPSRADGAVQFKGTVVFEDNKFCGVGRTKNAAKSAAAEAALKYLIKNKQLKLRKEEQEDEEGDVKMEISEDGTQVLPWSHIASFAMYKLFSSWGEEGLANRGLELLGNIIPKPSSVATPVPGQKVEPKPSRKMPEEPEKMNPCMLMNQMLPMAEWQELEKTGTPPHVNFTFSVTVDEKTFKGTGTSKKAAKKAAAFAACHDVLKVEYPADVWVPSPF